MGKEGEEIYRHPFDKTFYKTINDHNNPFTVQTLSVVVVVVDVTHTKSFPGSLSSHWQKGSTANLSPHTDCCAVDCPSVFTDQIMYAIALPKRRDGFRLNVGNHFGRLVWWVYFVEDSVVLITKAKAPGGQWVRLVRFVRPQFVVFASLTRRPLSLSSTVSMGWRRIWPYGPNGLVEVSDLRKAIGQQRVDRKRFTSGQSTNHWLWAANDP